MKSRDKKQTRENALKWCQMKMTLVSLKSYFFFFFGYFWHGTRKNISNDAIKNMGPAINIFLGENLSYTDWKDIIEK